MLDAADGETVLDSEAFRHWSRKVADWGVDYRDTVHEKPVRAQVAPGEILARLTQSPPERPEPMEDIFRDFEDIVMPGITHWQHPRFFAYFPSNAAPASVLADYLATAIAPQCMLWQTSPAATELESRMIDWLRQAVGLPEGFSGVLQDSASSATLVAVLTMREKALAWAGNKAGLTGQPRLRVYASDQVHTSIDRAIWVSGIGADNLVRIETTGNLRGMRPDALEAAVAADKAAGHLPAGVIVCVGGTSVGASDDIAKISEVAQRHGLYVHVDAAWAGTAMICPEFRHLWAGAETADSIVFNPHKWLGAQFDCSAHFIRNPEEVVRTLAIRPEYLKTHGKDGLINYSEWSVPLGRSFRALKLWFLLRETGLQGLRTMVRNHVAWAEHLARRMATAPGFEIVTQPMLSLFSFRHLPPDGVDINAHNRALVDRINDDGRIYVTQTLVDGRQAIRVQVGQWDTTLADVDTAFDVISELSSKE